MPLRGLVAWVTIKTFNVARGNYRRGGNYQKDNSSIKRKILDQSRADCLEAVPSTNRYEGIGRAKEKEEGGACISFRLFLATERKGPPSTGPQQQLSPSSSTTWRRQQRNPRTRHARSLAHAFLPSTTILFATPSLCSAIALHCLRLPSHSTLPISLSSSDSTVHSGCFRESPAGQTANIFSSNNK